MKQQSGVRALALLAILALVMAMSSVVAASPLVDDAVPMAKTAAFGFDNEPNDTPAQAVPITFGDHVFGSVDTTDVVDFYRFEGAAGNKVALATINYGSMNLALTDAAMNPVPLVEPTPWAALPASGTYYLAVTDPYPSQWGNNYTFELVLLTGDEPNDTIDMATTVPFGPTLAVSYDYPCDVDWLRFEGRAGDVLAEMNTNVVYENTFLYSADGVRMRGVNVLPADGTYYLRTEGYFSDKWDSECYEGAYDVDFGQALWVSAKADGLGGDASIKKGDIVTRKDAPNTWQIMFDASDVGITRNVVAFEYMPDGSLLMSFDRPQPIAGLGRVQPQDIVRFVPTSLGDNTAGTFEYFLDGSDVGLTTRGEKIDVIIMQADIDNPLRISTTGSGSVPRVSGGTLKFRDEDLINFVGDHHWTGPANAWRLALDGSTVPGMAGEDLNAGTRVELYPQRDSHVLYGMQTAFKINGTPGKPQDVIYGESWLPSVQRLTDKPFDALGVGPVWTP